MVVLGHSSGATSFLEFEEGFSWAGPRWQGGKVGGEVANNDEHAYMDVLFLFS
jgi:hypothetical protein